MNKITSGTKEWADININCIKGCSNDCRYCYAKMIAKRFGRCTNENWGEMIVNEKSLNKKYPKFNGRVMFPSSHDIPNDSMIKKACFNIIEKLLESRNDILITTKPDKIVIDEIIEKFSKYKEIIQFRFTITSKNNELLSFWERNAPNYEERLESLLTTYKNGFKTSVSVEPFLDYYPQELIKEVSPYATESIWIGPMNYIPRNNIPEKEFVEYQNIRKNYEFEHLKEIYQDLKNHQKIKFKDSFLFKIKMG